MIIFWGLLVFYVICSIIIALNIQKAPDDEPIAGPCTYCGSPDHWRPDCPQIPIDYPHIKKFQ